MKKTGVSILLIAILEAVIFYWSFSISNDPKTYFQLAARISARASFFLLVLILAWMGRRGLKYIYSKEVRRKNFATLILLLAVNHLIHFYFLVMNFQVNELTLLEPKSALGALGYLSMMALPLLLWRKPILTSSLYAMIVGFLTWILSFFIFSYWGRLTLDLPYPTPRSYFIASLALIGILIILNARMIFLDHRPTSSTTNR